MDAKEFTKFIEYAEARKRGWIRGGDCPDCDIWLDGRLMKCVQAMNRKKGVIRVSHDPIRIDKHRKRVLFHTLRGVVTVAPCAIQLSRDDCGRKHRKEQSALA